MTRSKRLRPLVRIAARREEAAASQLAKTRQRAVAFGSRLAELCVYREEYEREWRDTGSDSVSAERMKEVQVFLDRLNDAIREAQERLAAARQHTNERQGEWLSQRARCRALEQVVERARAAEWREAARREQREADDRGRRGGG